MGRREIGGFGRTPAQRISRKLYERAADYTSRVLLSMKKFSGRTGLLCGPLRNSASSALKWPFIAENAEIRRGPQSYASQVRSSS